MDKKKLFIALGITILAIITVYTLWRNPIILILTLLAISGIKHKLIPLKKEWTMFVISAIVGTGGECLIMFGGPWAYASVTIINFPIWLPFLWGLAGITGISIYQSIVAD